MDSWTLERIDYLTRKGQMRQLSAEERRELANLIGQEPAGADLGGLVGLALVFLAVWLIAGALSPSRE